MFLSRPEIKNIFTFSGFLGVWVNVQIWTQKWMEGITEQRPDNPKKTDTNVENPVNSYSFSPTFLNFIKKPMMVNL